MEYLFKNPELLKELEKTAKDIVSNVNNLPLVKVLKELLFIKGEHPHIYYYLNTEEYNFKLTVNVISEVITLHTFANGVPVLLEEYQFPKRMGVLSKERLVKILAGITLGISIKDILESGLIKKSHFISIK